MPELLKTWNAGRLIAATIMAWYGFTCLIAPNVWHFLDNVTLVFHEAGHVVFSPFGWFLTIAGGSLFQVIVPVVFVISFWKSGQRFAACVTALWVAASLFNLSVYVGDARARELPLLTGDPETHDWYQLLGYLKCLAWDKTLAALVWFNGAIWYVLAVAGAIFFSRGDQQNLPWQQSTRSSSTPVIQLRNLGFKSAQMLNIIGIQTLADLEDVGAIHAFRTLVKSGQKPGLSLLYALHGALVNQDWNTLASSTKEHLRDNVADLGVSEKIIS